VRLIEKIRFCTPVFVFLFSKHIERLNRKFRKIFIVLVYNNNIDIERGQFPSAVFYEMAYPVAQLGFIFGGVDLLSKNYIRRGKLFLAILKYSNRTFHWDVFDFIYYNMMLR